MNNIKEPIELSTLAGEHYLSGCDITTTQVLEWGERYVTAGVIRFILDGKVYEAIEDPEDGYRSNLEGLQLSQLETMENVFTPVRVIGVHRTEGYHGREDDVLELRNAANGKLVLEVGTDDVNDYYPGCVMDFCGIEGKS